MQTLLIIAGHVLLIGTAVVVAFLLRKGKKDKPEKPIIEEPTRLLRDETKSNDEYDELIERLIGLFETEKTCLKTDVRLSEVASMLSVGKSTLSKAIKMKTGKNFCQLVHYYRVREAMRIFANHPKLSVKEISQMVGFNSQTTFITAFGRHTGSTPAEWCRQYRNRIGSLGYDVKNKRKNG